MFRFNHHRQGAHYSSFLKLLLLKYSIDAMFFIEDLINICGHTIKLTTPMHFD